MKGPVSKVQGTGMAQVSTDPGRWGEEQVGSSSQQKWVTWRDPRGWF